MGLGPNARTDTLHLHGTDAMKTVDIFQYFADYPPASIEWLTDKSCKFEIRFNVHSKDTSCLLITAFGISML